MFSARVALYTVRSVPVVLCTEFFWAQKTPGQKPHQTSGHKSPNYSPNGLLIEYYVGILTKSDWTKPYGISVSISSYRSLPNTYEKYNMFLNKKLLNKKLGTCSKCFFKIVHRFSYMFLFFPGVSLAFPGLFIDFPGKKIENPGPGQFLHVSYSKK